MTPDELRALIEEVEAFDGTTEEGRALADECLLACGWTHGCASGDLVSPNGVPYDRHLRPNPLADVQHALDLLPEGCCRYSLNPTAYDGRAVDRWQFIGHWLDYEGSFDGQGRTAAAAITAANLEARGC